jgi:hypothetical protein
MPSYTPSVPTQKKGKKKQAIHLLRLDAAFGKPICTSSASRTTPKFFIVCKLLPEVDARARVEQEEDERVWDEVLV